MAKLNRIKVVLAEKDLVALIDIANALEVTVQDLVRQEEQS